MVIDYRRTSAISTSLEMESRRNNRIQTVLSAHVFVSAEGSRLRCPGACWDCHYRSQTYRCWLTRALEGDVACEWGVRGAYRTVQCLECHSASQRYCKLTFFGHERLQTLSAFDFCHGEDANCDAMCWCFEGIGGVTINFAEAFPMQLTKILSSLGSH